MNCDAWRRCSISWSIESEAERSNGASANIDPTLRAMRCHEERNHVLAIMLLGSARNMNPFDYSKAITDFWTAQTKTLLAAQTQAAKALADGIQAVASGKLPMLPALSDGALPESSDLANAGKSMMELWSAATSTWGKLATTVPASAGGDPIVQATFRRMVDPRSWTGGTGEMDDVLGRMAEGPRFADLWEVERRYVGVMQAWMNVRRRGLEHNAVVLEAWLRAARQFTENLAQRPNPSAGLDGKAALGLWTETANKQLLETQRSEPFLKSQAAMIRATTELRVAQQELVEHFGKQYGFPTRTELDDLHRTVTELRRELRAMRRELRPPDSPPTLPPAVSEPPPPLPAIAEPEAVRTPRRARQKGGRT